MTTRVKQFFADGSEYDEMFEALKLLTRKLKDKTVNAWCVDPDKGLKLYNIPEGQSIVFPLDDTSCIQWFPTSFPLKLTVDVAQLWADEQKLTDWIPGLADSYIDEDEEDGWEMYADAEMDEYQICYVRPALVMYGK